MTTLRLQSWATNRGPTRYTVNLDGVPLGCDGLFKDPALVITVGSEVAKVPHQLRDDGAMMFDEWARKEARSVADRALRAYQANDAERNKSVHFDRVVASGSPAEARAILGADCDRLLAMRAQEILDRIGTGRPSVWDESLCQSCGKKLEDPQNTTRCAPCAAARSVWTKPSSFAESAHSNPDTYCKECKALAEKRLAQDLLPMGEGWK